MRAASLHHTPPGRCSQYEKRWRNRSCTYESVKRQAIVAVENMLRVLHGQTPHAQANIL